MVDERSLTVLHLCWRLSRTGGIAGVIRSLAAGLEGTPVRVEVATVRPVIPDDGAAEAPGVAAVHGLGHTGSLASAGVAWSALRFAAVARRVRPDVIHTHSGTAVLSVLGALAAPGARRLLDVHDAPGNARHSRATEWAEGFLCRRLRYRPVAHSRSVRAETAAAWNLPAGSLPVVPLCVGPEFFDPAGGAAWRASLGIAPGAVVVLNVGRLVPTKNVDLLVDAADLLHRRGVDVTCVVVAGGSEEAALRNRIHALGLGERFVLTGPVPPAALVAAYDGADVFCSTSDYEGFGLAVAEAMAAGVPVVSTAVGGVTDVVVNGTTGILVPAGDAVAVAAGLEWLAADAALRAQFGEAGRRRAVDRFDRRRMVADYAAVYEGAFRPSETVAVLKSPAFGPPSDGPLPYRMDLLRRNGFELAWTDRHLARRWRSGAPAKVLGVVEGRAAPVLQSALLAPALTRSSAVLAMFESEGHALAALRSLPGPWRRPALAVVACWLAELLERAVALGAGVARYRLAYRHVDLLVYFSRNQTETFETVLGVEPARLCPVPFGIDEQRYPPAEGAGSYVLAVGRDQGRDWPTFFAAAGRSGLPVKVACRRQDVAGIEVPPNVEVLGYVDADAYRSLLAGARVSVVPSRERAYPSGQSVFLESLSTARATVVTRTPAMDDYVDDGVTCVGVPPYDAGAMEAAVRRLWDDGAERERLGAAGRRAVEERFNAGAMWDAIGDALHRVIGSRRGGR